VTTAADKPKQKFQIYPSIDSLVTSIKDLSVKKKVSADQIESLRELCIKKLRSYRMDEYLKRYTTEADKLQARNRWAMVIEFANRSRLGATTATAAAG